MVQIDFSEGINLSDFVRRMEREFLHQMAQYCTLASQELIPTQELALPLIAGAGGDIGNYYLIFNALRGKAPDQKSHEILERLVLNMEILRNEVIGRREITLPKETALYLIDEICNEYTNLRIHLASINPK